MARYPTPDTEVGTRQEMLDAWTEFVQTLNDTFTDATGVDLAAHVGDSGVHWTKHPSYPAGDEVISNANRVRGNANGQNNLYYSSWVPQSPDYVIGLLFHVFSSFHAGFCFAIDPTSTAAYTYRWSSSLNQHILSKVSAAGVETILDAATDALVLGQDLPITIDCSGTGEINVFKGSSLILTTTDSSIPLLGRPVGPFLANGPSNVDNTHGIHLDSVSITERQVAGVRDGQLWLVDDDPWGSTLTRVEDGALVPLMTSGKLLERLRNFVGGINTDATNSWVDMADIAGEFTLPFDALVKIVLKAPGNSVGTAGGKAWMALALDGVRVDSTARQADAAASGETSFQLGDIHLEQTLPLVAGTHTVKGQVRAQSAGGAGANINHNYFGDISFGSEESSINLTAELA